jgi:hypothetical protein
MRAELFDKLRTALVEVRDCPSTGSVEAQGAWVEVQGARVEVQAHGQGSGPLVERLMALLDLI